MCLTCVISDRTCESCPAGTYLFDNQCVINCPDRMFNHDENRACFPCSNSCLKCTSSL